MDKNLLRDLAEKCFKANLTPGVASEAVNVQVREAQESGAFKPQDFQQALEAHIASIAEPNRAA